MVSINITTSLNQHTIKNQIYSIYEKQEYSNFLEFFNYYIEINNMFSKHGYLKHYIPGKIFNILSDDIYIYNYIYSQYLPIFIFIIISGIFAIILLIISYFVSTQIKYGEKLSAYECGFDPFGDARLVLDVRYYLVAILFIIFDLEIIFIFPWVSAINTISAFGFWSMIYFLMILTIGFIYELKKSAFDWE